MLLNAEGKVFVGRRIDTTMEAWQMPQGGIDEGETVWRELEEEIGTRNAELVAKNDKWLFYDLPDELIGKVWGGKYKGQKQIWYLMKFKGSDSDIDLETYHPEFSDWKWVDMADVPRLIVPFKRALYQAVVQAFEPYLEKL